MREIARPDRLSISCREAGGGQAAGRERLLTGCATPVGGSRPGPAKGPRGLRSNDDPLRGGPTLGASNPPLRPLASNAAVVSCQLRVLGTDSAPYCSGQRAAQPPRRREGVHREFHGCALCEPSDHVFPLCAPALRRPWYKEIVWWRAEGEGSMHARPGWYDPGWRRHSTAQPSSRAAEG
jgi:hypothetical protein